MKRLKKFFLWFLIIVIVVIVSLAVFLRVRFGGGKEYQDISTAPKYTKEQTERVFSYKEPIGNVAATPAKNTPTRVFFTIHPESRPETNKLMEIVDNKAVPYPSAKAQSELFNTVLGVFADKQNRNNFV